MSLLNKSFIDFINDMQDPRKDILLKIYHDYKELFHYAKGSNGGHQSWHGGYADHIAECFRINEAYYAALSAIRDPGFSKNSALIVLFFHDIEKLFKYGPSNNADTSKWTKAFNASSKSWDGIKVDILDELKAKYNFSFTAEELNALKYTHGEGKDYTPGKRIASPLAAHVHHCDNTSARIWYDEGQKLAWPSPKK